MWKLYRVLRYIRNEADFHHHSAFGEEYFWYQYRDAFIFCEHIFELELSKRRQ